MRAAKGHEIDPRNLSYRPGDGYRAMARGRSNQLAVFLDSTGRAYCIPSHTLSSARGQGEPLAGRINPPDGATFEGVMIGAADQLYVLATDAGYGFVARLEDLWSRNRAGKACISVGREANLLVPRPAADPATERLAAVSSEGRLLVHPLAELPRLAKGKGVKIVRIPAAKPRPARSTSSTSRSYPPAPRSPSTPASGTSPSSRPSSTTTRSGAGGGGRTLPRGFQRAERLEIRRA